MLTCPHSRINAEESTTFAGNSPYEADGSRVRADCQCNALRNASHAARLIVTMGRCFCPAWYATSSSSRTPGLPRIGNWPPTFRRVAASSPSATNLQPSGTFATRANVARTGESTRYTLRRVALRRRSQLPNRLCFAVNADGCSISRLARCQVPNGQSYWNEEATSHCCANLS